VPVMTLVQAVNDGLRQEMARDDSVMVLGEDVARLGGVFRATDGLLDQFGADRCVDTPLAEAGIVGTAIGLALAGWRPVCEMQYEAFSYPALDQVLSHLSRYRWRSGGAIEMPIVIRMPYGGGVRAPELHEDSPEAYYAHAPGIKVALPGTPADAKGLIAAAVRDPDPVVVLEPKALYRASAGPVPDGEHFVELGQAIVARHWTDATLIVYGAMVPVATAAAERLAGRGDAEVEVLDLRTLTPLDEDAVLDSVGKTGRAVIVHEAPRTAGFGAEVAALLADRGILSLRAPVRRVTGFDVPYPYWSLEDRYVPSVDRVVRALEEVLRF
jgi:pyruvate dehydrogenase E1 component beta subunit